VHPTVRVSRFGDDDEVLHWLPLTGPFEHRALAPIQTFTPTRFPSVPSKPTQPIDSQQRIITFLSNSQALMEEGAAMKHCVSVHVDDCLTQRMHIASVTDGTGRRCSTVAIRIDWLEGGWRAQVTEHRTTRNRAPDAVSERAVTALLAALNHPNRQAHYAQIETARATRETLLNLPRQQHKPRNQTLRRAALRHALPAHIAWAFGLEDD
jgi:hypothetical protein